MTENEIKSISKQNLNPWFSMWTKPRATIQQIIDTNPKQYVLLLAVIEGISWALDRADAKHAGDGPGGSTRLSIILLLAICIGPLWGILQLYAGSALLRWTGKWIGGRATMQNIRAAIAWSYVPVIWVAILWIPAIAIFGKELFAADIPETDNNILLLLFAAGFYIIKLAAIAWTMIISLNCLGQVQGFSTWKALANVALSTAIVGIPVSIFMGIRWLMH